MAKALTPNALARAFVTLTKAACGADGFPMAEKALADLMDHIEALEALLSETDQEDFFGTEGWRHRLGIDQ
jgi:hypothetical protein